MAPTAENPNWLRAWSYVFVQAVLLVLIVFLHQSVGPHIRHFVILGWICELSGVLGIFISAASLRKSLTAVPIPKADGKLSTRGLYRYVRHPMYTSVLLLVLGIALKSGNGIKYLLVIALYLLFFMKSTYEEMHLRKKYPEYAEYSAQIPRFVPFTKKFTS